MRLPTLLLACVVSAYGATATKDAELERRFAGVVKPFLSTYCSSCHGGSAPEAGLDLGQYASLDSVVRDHAHWAIVAEKLVAKDMPPKPLRQPPDAVRQRVIEWIEDVRKHEARKNAGDPGLVLARRLSNAEYDYTIRDLTGVDLRPAREFPVDPANQEGFDNSGESLAMSPALFDKYLQAARQVANHLVLKPDGTIAFAPHPMLVETDREKYAVQRIIDFYARQPTDFADYFHASWRYKYRAALGQPKATLAGIAADLKLSPQYLPVVWEALERKEEVGPLAKLQGMWRDLPAPNGTASEGVRESCVRMRDYVVGMRWVTAKLINTPDTPDYNPNSQPIAMWKNRQVAATHREFDKAALRVEGDPPPGDFVVTLGPTFGSREAAELKIAKANYIKERNEHPELLVPRGERPRYEAAFARFANVFPDKFYLAERSRFYPIELLDAKRYLSAGLHNIMGYFRDDTALQELILDDRGKKELDTLWEEFEYIADITLRTYMQYFNSGGRLRDGTAQQFTYEQAATEPAIFAIRDQLLAKASADMLPEFQKAIRDHFDGVNATIRWVERTRQKAEPLHLESLLKFAARAYRRPLEPVERDSILGQYRKLRENSSMTHEEAMRLSIGGILVSPDFCFRIDMIDPDSDSPQQRSAK
jgi:hypothetical protein